MRIWPLLVAALLPGTASAEPPRYASFEQCDGLIRKAPDAYDGYVCYYAVARQRDRYAEATRRLAAYLADDPDNPKLLNYYASLLHDQADPRAPEIQARLADIFAHSGDRDSETRLRLNLNYLYYLGDDRFAEQLPAAEEAAILSGDPELLALVRTVQARSTYREEIDAARALDLLQESKALALGSSMYLLRVSWLQSHKDLMHILGRREEMIETARLLAENAQRQNDAALALHERLDVVARYANNAELRDALAPGELDALATDALAEADKSELPELRGRAICIRGDLAPDAKTAVRYFEDCIAQYAAAGLELPSVLAENAVAMAQAEAGIGDPLATIERAYERRLQFVGEAASERFLRLQLLWQADDPRAVAASAEHVAALEAETRREADLLLRAALMTGLMQDAGYIAGRMLGPDVRNAAPAQVEAALRTIERLRARVLSDALQIAGADPFAHADADLRARHRALSAEIAKVHRSLQVGAAEGDERKELLARLERLETEEHGLWGDLVRTTPDATRLYEPTPFDLAALQQALGPGRALISYQLTPALERPAWWTDQPPSWAAVVTHDTVRVVVLPRRAQLEPVIDIFAGLFEHRDASEGTLAVELYKQVLAEALEHVPAGVDELVLIPDGPLHRLPFAALRPTEDAPALSDHYALTLVPSVEIWNGLATRADRAGLPPLVLADPAGLSAGRLPHARAEAEVVIGNIGEDGVMRLGEGASEAFAKQMDASQYSLVHIAAHAVQDGVRPERAAVVLAPGGEEEDGLLRLREIAELDLDGTAVVLAACESASGTVLAGEGPVGLARGFFQARARVVVASLWRLRDDDAEAFFAAFYRELGEGNSVTRAVQAAQRVRRKAGAPAAGWAGIVVIGDGSYVPHPVQARYLTPTRGLAFVGLLILLGGTLLSRRKRAGRGTAEDAPRA